MAVLPPPKPKKTELLQIRLDRETKDRLMELAAARGTTITSLIESGIQAILAPGRQEDWTRLEARVRVLEGEIQALKATFRKI